jgi:hypothetical protein
MRIVGGLPVAAEPSSQKRPTTMATMKEEDAQTAAMLSLAVQSRFEVRCMMAPFDQRGFLPL